MGLLDVVLPVTGTVSLLGFFLSPIPTMHAVYKKKATGRHSIDDGTLLQMNTAFLAMAISGILWITYALAIANPMIALPNALGLVLSIVYTYISYNAFEHQSSRDSLLARSSMFLAVLAIVLLYLNFVVELSDLLPTLGIAAALSNIVMFSSPLLHLPHILNKKDTRFILWLFVLTALVHTLSWLLNGMIDNNVFSKRCNGASLLAVAIQLGFKLAYKNRQSTAGAASASEESRDMQSIVIQPTKTQRD